MTSVVLENNGSFSATRNSQPYDTVDSVRNELAFSMATLPEVIVLNEDFLLTNETVTGTNLKEAVRDTDVFKNFAKRFSDIDHQSLVTAYTLARRDIGLGGMDELTLNEIRSYEEKAKLRQLIELPKVGLQLDLFLKEYENRQNSLSELLGYAELNTTGLIAEEIVFSSVITTNNNSLVWTTLADIFNRANPTVLAPVVVMGTKWKILHGTQGYPESIVEQSPDSLYIFLEIAPETFTIAHLAKNQLDQIVIYVEAIDASAAIPPQELAARAMSVFQIPPDNINMELMEQTFAKGGINYFNTQFNPDVLADIILNDSLIKTWFYKDDLRKVTREKQGLFIYFTPSHGVKWPITLATGYLSDATDQQRLRFGKTHHSGGYVTAKIKSKSESQTAFLQQAINGLLQHYAENSEMYAELYRTFIPNWVEIPPPKRRTAAAVRDLDILKLFDQKTAFDPVLFPKRIGRKCTPNKQPWVVLDPVEIERIKNSDDPETYIMFPREREYPLFRRKFQDWVTPRLFTCKRKNDRGRQLPEQYMNMVELPKPLPNPSDPNMIRERQVPVALCCAARPPGEKSILNQWKSGKSDNFVHITNRSTRPFTTQKIAHGDGGRAVLPKGVQKILSSINANGTWYRYGVNSRENSAIESVAMAVGESKLTEERLREYRQSQDVLSVVCSQENPGKTVSIINDEIRGDQYFSPRSLYRFLEELFNVQILIFVKGSNGEGTLYAPRTLYGEYFFYRPDRKVVCLYEHMGSESNALHFPQTELIGYTSDGRGRGTVFAFDGESGEQLIDFKIKVSRFTKWSHSAGSAGLAAHRPAEQAQGASNQIVPVIPNATRQVIDQFGKCRGLEISNKFFIEIPPSPPYNLPVMELRDIKRWNKWNKLSKYNIRLSHEPVDGRNPGVMALQDFSIPVVVVSAPVVTNITTNFWRNKKLARVIQELFYREFAKWWEEHEGTFISEELSQLSLELFADNHTEINENYQYPEPSVDNNPGFYNNNKLILPSETAKTRLIYALLREYRSQPEKVLAQHQYLQSIFLDRYDYTRVPGVALIDESRLEEFKTISKTSEIVVSFVIEPKLKDAYFLMLESRVYLARNYDNLDDAVNSGVGWETFGRMEAVPVRPPDVQWNYTLYVKREKYRIGPIDGRFIGSFEVLGYKYLDTDSDNVPTNGYTVVYW